MVATGRDRNPVTTGTGSVLVCLTNWKIGTNFWRNQYRNPPSGGDPEEEGVTENESLDGMSNQVPRVPTSAEQPVHAALALLRSTPERHRGDP